MADSKSDSIIDGHFATKVGDNPLWQHACQVYSQAGVEKALLQLQDQHGADINLILQAVWLASKGIEWTPACIPTDYGKWVEEHVIPIRIMRRRLKTDWVEQRDLIYEDFRQQVKALELKAEQYALAMLYQQASIFLLKEPLRASLVDDTIGVQNTKEAQIMSRLNLTNLAQYLTIPAELLLTTLVIY